MEHKGETLGDSTRKSKRMSERGHTRARRPPYHFAMRVLPDLFWMRKKRICREGGGGSGVRPGLGFVLLWVFVSRQEQM